MQIAIESHDFRIVVVHFITIVFLTFSDSPWIEYADENGQVFSATDWKICQTMWPCLFLQPDQQFGMFYKMNILDKGFLRR